VRGNAEGHVLQWVPALSSAKRRLVDRQHLRQWINAHTASVPSWPYKENDAMSRPSDWSKVTRPIPVPNEWTKPYWDAARRGVLELQRCQSCGHFQHPPYATCTQCVSTDLKFEAVRGAGAIYAYTIMYHTGDKRLAPAVPYASIIVELDDAPGALLAGNLLEAPYTAAKVGRRVEVVFEKLNDDITLPQFRLMRTISVE
jgi:uncharacterized OB-fold protein